MAVCHHQPPCLLSTGLPTGSPCTHLRRLELMRHHPCVAGEHSRIRRHKLPSCWQCAWVCLGASPLHYVSRVPLCTPPAFRRPLLTADLGPLPPFAEGTCKNLDPGEVCPHHCKREGGLTAPAQDNQFAKPGTPHQHDVAQQAVQVSFDRDDLLALPHQSLLQA